MVERRFYTYMHRRKSDGQIFYIGKGNGARYRSGYGRNAYWNRVVAKHGFNAQVLAEWHTEKQALDHEIFLIKCFREMGAPLVNGTDGGQGLANHVYAPEFVARRAAKLKKRMLCVDTGEIFESIGAAAEQCGVTTGCVWRASGAGGKSAGGFRWARVPKMLAGEQLSTWITEQMAAPVPLVGVEARSLTQSKRVLIIRTGVVHETSRAAASALGVTPSNISHAIRGFTATAGGERVCYAPRELSGDALAAWVAEQQAAHPSRGAEARQ